MYMFAVAIGVASIDCGAKELLTTFDTDNFTYLEATFSRSSSGKY